MENEKLPRFKRGEGERVTASSNTFFLILYTNHNQGNGILFYFNIYIRSVEGQIQ